MSCSYCTARDKLREEARIRALEQQNTDLIAIVRELMGKCLSFNIRVDPTTLMTATDRKAFENHLAKQAASMAKHSIERLLEERSHFFHDYNLLKMYASRDYYTALNEDLIR